jgi:hypothetical protein
MAKIRTFEEYEACSKSLEDELESRLETRVMTLIRNDPLYKREMKWGARHLKAAEEGNLTLIRRGRVYQINHGKLKEARDSFEVRLIAALKERHLTGAKTDSLRSICREDLENLSEVAVHLSKRGDLKPRNETIYQRCLSVYNVVANNDTFELSEDLSHLDKDQEFSESLRLLHEKKVVSKKVVEKLTKSYFNPEKKKKTIKKTKAVEKTALILEKYPTRDATLVEYLQDVFDFAPSLAEHYSLERNLGEVLNLHDKLEIRVGNVAAELISANPEILNYQKLEILADYLRVLKQVTQKINNHPEFEEEFGLANNLVIYAHRDSLLKLKDDLYSRIRGPEKERTSREIEIHKYTLFHRTLPMVENRLDFLIREGYLAVNGRDYWDGATGGTRGLNILLKVRHQMKTAFAEFNLPEPTVHIKWGQKILSIGPQDQTSLREVRDKLYAMQETNGTAVI